jgi:hypothetical protein
MSLIGSVGRCHFGYRLDVKEMYPEANSWDDAIERAEREALETQAREAELKRAIRSFEKRKAEGEPFPAA